MRSAMCLLLDPDVSVICLLIDPCLSIDPN